MTCAELIAEKKRTDALDVKLIRDMWRESAEWRRMTTPVPLAPREEGAAR